LRGQYQTALDQSAHVQEEVQQLKQQIAAINERSSQQDDERERMRVVRTVSFLCLG